ncbi:slit homolog 1 protein-like isoform X2 [Papaver somniferum]|uniref:slit homolog 1 protein-like isoform X2 n=1 Tax=Papaver somniferum TaxID=3469 RepID=UPI000E701354|nr:slit homolog 1 protein-like isoform X2 [Papaver somniferum]
MGSYKFTILLPFFIVFIVLNSRLGNSQLPPGLFPDPCNHVNCVQGKCRSNDTIIPVCHCNPGWKNLQIANITIPLCIIPDCTFDLDCGGTSLPPPSPSLSACLWCGYGTCVKDGDANVCKCDQGSANLFNKKDMPCFKECSLGADCINLGFDFGSPPAPGTENGQGSGSAQDAPSSSGARQTLTMLVVVGTFLSWF